MKILPKLANNDNILVINSLSMISNNIANISDKEASVIKTLAFFDMFNFPLTAFEIWQYLEFKCDLVEIIDILDNSKFLSLRLRVKDGYYFFKDKEEIILTRLERYHSSARKFNKAKKFVYLFRLLPWLKMVAMANMIGADNLRDESDIDLFIITTSKRIWITRFFCVLIIKLLNARPKPGKEQDKICLSFYISEDSMNVKDLMIDNDVYFRYWLVSLFPILNINKTYEKFVKTNRLIEKEFPNWQAIYPVKNKRVNKINNNIYSEMFDLFFGGLNLTVKKLQLKLLAKELKQKLNKDTRVVMNDKVLKMYAKDRREIYKKRYLNKLKDFYE